MDTKDLERRLAEVRTRLAKLPPEDQERALDGFAQVLTVLGLPRAKEDAVQLSISLGGKRNVEYKSG